MLMTTIRVRRLKAKDAQALGVDVGGRDLIEVIAHGEPVCVLDAATVQDAAKCVIRRNPGRAFAAAEPVWHVPAFDDSVGDAIVVLAAASLDVMAQARHLYGDREPVAA